MRIQHATSPITALLLLAGCSNSNPGRASIPESERLVLALAGVDSKVNPEGPPVANAASEFLLDSLVSCGQFRVVERARLDTLLEEQGGARYSKIGKLAGAQWIAYGSITEVVFRGESKPDGPRHIGEVQLHLRVVRVEDGTFMYSRSHRGVAEGTSTDSVDKLLKKAAQNAVEELVREIAALPR